MTRREQARAAGYKGLARQRELREQSLQRWAARRWLEWMPGARLGPKNAPGFPVVVFDKHYLRTGRPRPRGRPLTLWDRIRTDS